MQADTVDQLFVDLARWIDDEGSRGCLFLRARGETGGEDPDVSETVASYRSRLRNLFRRTVARDLGRDDERTTTQVLLLFEGATSAAGYIGSDAVEAARDAAETIMRSAPSPTVDARKA